MLIGKNVYKNIQKKAKLQQKRIDLSLSIRCYMEDLNVFSTVDALRRRLNSISENESIGFVPTMGALHHGHLSLVEKAFEQTDIVVVSIFVNPTQFNNASDLTNYPRTLEKDIKLLQTAGDVIVFAPTKEEIYPTSFRSLELELGVLGTVMEGKYRPGHFKGVMNVVKRLFDIVQPAKAFFGLKDFQQLAVINHMVKKLNIPIEIVPCEIFRETSGLASSSRNMRLTEEEFDRAKIIYEAMTWAKFMANHQTPDEVIDVVTNMINNEGLEVEYISIVDPASLTAIKEWQSGAHMCVVAYCGEIRLIDNMQLIDSLLQEK